MDKDKHKEITKRLSESLGGNGFSDVFTSIFVVIGVLLVVAGSKIPSNDDSSTIISLVLMSTGTLFFSTGLLWSKLSDLDKKINNKTYSKTAKILCGSIAGFYWSFAFFILLTTI